MNKTEEKKIGREESAIEEKIEEAGGEELPKRTSFEELNRKLEDYETEIKNLKDKYLRALADQDNLRKRVEREKAELFNYGLTNFIRELLPIVDTLESALVEAQKSNDNPTGTTGIIEGINLTLTKFRSTLKKHGVNEIEALNRPFDPTLHEAISKTERDDVEPMTIVEEIAKGYVLKGRILRPSKVIVAVEPSDKQKDSQAENTGDKGPEIDNG